MFTMLYYGGYNAKMGFSYMALLKFKHDNLIIMEGLWACNGFAMLVASPLVN